MITFKETSQICEVFFGSLKKLSYICILNKTIMEIKELKIVSARITAMPKSFFDAMPEVWITFENGNEELLFDYYPDEISFTSSEFIGLTKSQAINLKFKKDKAYLQS